MKEGEEEAINIKEAFGISGKKLEQLDKSMWVLRSGHETYRGFTKDVLDWVGKTRLSKKEIFAIGYWFGRDVADNEEENG